MLVYQRVQSWTSSIQFTEECIGIMRMHTSILYNIVEHIYTIIHTHFPVCVYAHVVLIFSCFLPFCSWGQPLPRWKRRRPAWLCPPPWRMTWMAPASARRANRRPVKIGPKGRSSPGRNGDVMEFEANTHRIHGAAIYGNIYHQYTPNVSIYTSTMDPMGMDLMETILMGYQCGNTL